VIVFNDPVFALNIAKAAAATNFDPFRDPSIATVGSSGGSGKLLGGVIFQDCTGPGGSISIHAAGFLPKWLNRGMLWHMFEFPFNTVGVKKVIGHVPVNNYNSTRLCLHVGFTLETTIADVYPGPNGDLFIFSMYREACRWLDLPKPNVLVIDGSPNGQIPSR
jgi:RimJ/RimL family protein N-acetyltransferase